MPQPSFSEKTILGSSFFGIFIGGSREWTYLFLSHVFFLGSSVFRLLLVLPRLSLSLQQVVCYLLPSEFYPDHPVVGTYGAPSF